MIGTAWWLLSAGLLCAACNSGAPEPASVEISSGQIRLTIVRMATDPFLSRHSLTLSVTGVTGGQGCSASAELFPDTGYAGRRNVYLTTNGSLYIVGQFDARVIDTHSCRISLSEFRHLQREVVFVGSFDEDAGHRWTYFPSKERPEQPLAKHT